MELYLENTNPKELIIEISNIFDVKTCQSYTSVKKCIFKKSLIRQVTVVGTGAYGRDLREASSS